MRLNDRTPSVPSRTPEVSARKKRFRVEKLEERIAPRKPKAGAASSATIY